MTTVVSIREQYDVYIGRAGKGQDGYFGNPVLIKPAFDIVLERQRVINGFADYFNKRVAVDCEFVKRVLQLRGKRLGCFCKPLPCHGDVIAAWVDNAMCEGCGDAAFYAVSDLTSASVHLLCCECAECGWLMLTHIISGGQTGVDQAALRAARAAGLRTGGWAPRGYRTLDGNAPWLADYGLCEARGSDYAMRTYLNVRDSDATVRIATDFDTPGERCTLNACRRHNKPYFDVKVGRVTSELLAVDITDGRIDYGLKMFFGSYGVVNIAGNSETTCPGIGALAENLLVNLFRNLTVR